MSLLPPRYKSITAHHWCGASWPPSLPSVASEWHTATISSARGKEAAIPSVRSAGRQTAVTLIRALRQAWYVVAVSLAGPLRGSWAASWRFAASSHIFLTAHGFHLTIRPGLVWRSYTHADRWRLAPPKVALAWFDCTAIPAKIVWYFFFVLTRVIGQYRVFIASPWNLSSTVPTLCLDPHH